MVPHHNPKNDKKMISKSKNSKTNEHSRKSDTIDAIQAMRKDWHIKMSTIVVHCMYFSVLCVLSLLLIETLKETNDGKQCILVVTIQLAMAQVFLTDNDLEEHTNFKVPAKWNGYDVYKLHRNIVAVGSHTMLVTSGGIALSFGSGLNGRLGHANISPSSSFFLRM